MITKETILEYLTWKEWYKSMERKLPEIRAKDMEEKIPFNEGIYKQLCKIPVRPREKLTARDIILAIFSLGYTENIKHIEPVKTEEELDTALEHYFRVEGWKSIN